MIGTARAQQPTAPVRTFANRCRICHGSDGNGTDRAPALLGFVGSHSDAEITTLVHTGRLDKGMPRFDFTDDEMKELLTHLRGLVYRALSSLCQMPGLRFAVPRLSSLTRSA
jgi:mono/diheme cytochrome c family protein